MSTRRFIKLGSGSFRADDDVIKVNKEKHPQSYQDLEKWIQETIANDN